MSKRAKQLFGAAGMVAVLAFAPTATAGSACPTGPGCEPVGPRLDDARTKAKEQRVRLAPRIFYERDGQSVWRAGNHLMY